MHRACAVVELLRERRLGRVDGYGEAGWACLRADGYSPERCDVVKRGMARQAGAVRYVGASHGVVRRGRLSNGVARYDSVGLGQAG
jgi:hypothetical protein